MGTKEGKYLQQVQATMVKEGDMGGVEAETDIRRPKKGSKEETEAERGPETAKIEAEAESLWKAGAKIKSVVGAETVLEKKSGVETEISQPSVY